MCMSVCFIFFFKQKTAYEMRISDWSSDVCSSDLRHVVHRMHKMLVEGKTAVPELCPSLSADKLVMEDEAGKNGSECQYAQRNEHIPRAFMRVISASPYSYGMSVMLMRRRFGAGSTEARRVGKEGVGTCRSRWTPEN